MVPLFAGTWNREEYKLLKMFEAKGPSRFAGHSSILNVRQSDKAEMGPPLRSRYDRQLLNISITTDG